MAGPSKYKEWQSLPAMFVDQARQFGDKPLAWAKRDGQFQSMSWRRVNDEMRRLARGLRAVGMEDGDRIVLVSENRPKWLVADLAIMSGGGITVPAYTTNTVDDHRHILNDSSAAFFSCSS